MDNVEIVVFSGEAFTQEIDCDASANASGYTLPATLTLRVASLGALTSSLIVAAGSTVVDKTVTTTSTTAGTFPFVLTAAESVLLTVGTVYGWQASTDAPFVVAQGTVVALRKYAANPSGV